MGKLFGTDGIRGIANKDLTPELDLYLQFLKFHQLMYYLKVKKAKLLLERILENQEICWKQH